jgi:hypothetical protein
LFAPAKPDRYNIRPCARRIPQPNQTSPNSIPVLLLLNLYGQKSKIRI